MIVRPRLGSWYCRSGNGVDVYVRPGTDGTVHVELEWDTPPPLGDADQYDYVVRIRPAIVRQARAYLERVGPVLVVPLVAQ